MATTPLMEASSRGHLELVKLLTKHSTIDMADQHGSTALYYAVDSPERTFKLKIAEHLLTAGANPNITPSGLRVGSIFCVAITKGGIDLVRIFLRNGAGIQSIVPEIRFPIGEAASIGDIEIIGELLSRGASVNSQDAAGGTALLFASSRCHCGAVKLLLERGANPNLLGSRGETSVIAACSQIGSTANEAAGMSYLKIIRFLLQSGANPNVLAKNGWASLDFVEYWPTYYKREDSPGWIHAAIDLLRQFGAKRRSELASN